MNIKESKAISLLLCLFAICANSFSAFAQTTNSTSDPYTLTIESRDGKPELQYFQVRLKGDNGVSLIDLDGNIIARNFTPINNSYGKVVAGNYSIPVINDIFCVVRYKNDSDWKLGRSSLTIYHNASSPTYIPGLTDLYSANISNPNLFPISRYGERIKFVDNNGKEKFTVMPIDGKEPSRVYSHIQNGIILVEVDNEKYGAINTTGKWVIYPEWREIVLIDGTILGYNDKGEIYKITLTDKSSHATRFEIPIDFYDYIRLYGSKYLVEEFFDNGEWVSNIYDRDYKYIATLNNTDYVRPNLTHPDLLLVRKKFKSGMDSSECLIDISKNNAVVSKYYSEMNELPDGNYLAHNKTTKSDGHRYWYVKADGTETALPNNTEFPLRHPGMALLYRGTVKNFFVEATAGKCGYICDSKGNEVGNLEIEEYYNSQWEYERVESSYYCINKLDKNYK